LKKLAKNLLARAGYDINRRPQPIYGDGDAFDRNLAVVRASTMLPEARLVSLNDQVVFCDRHGIEGAFVECGVWKGGAVGLMALAASEPKTRPLHLFDAFTDICEPDPAVDGAKAVEEASRIAAPVGRLKPMEGIYDSIGGHGTLEECRALIERTIGYPADRVHYHVGWFQDTVPQDAASIGPVAILRIDGDWYASTKVCLDHHFDKVVPGGFVIIDDYGTYEGCRKAVDEFLAQSGVAAFLHRVDNGCHYFVKA